jgi:hypothetical protein
MTLAALDVEVIEQCRTVVGHRVDVDRDILRHRATTPRLSGAIVR